MEEEKNNCQITCVNFYLARTGLIDIDAQVQVLVLPSLVASVDVVGKEGSNNLGGIVSFHTTIRKSDLQ